MTRIPGGGVRTITLPRAEAVEFYENQPLLFEEIVRHSRWHVHHRSVFLHDGSYYEAEYMVGATESQHCSMWEDEETVTFHKVLPRAVTTVMFVREKGGG